MSKLSDSEKESIQALVDYLWEDEIQDAANNQDIDLDGHIFSRLVEVSNLLDGKDEEPTSVLRSFCAEHDIPFEAPYHG